MGALPEQPGGQSLDAGGATSVGKVACACERCGYCVGETLAVCGGCGAAAVRDTPGRRGDRRTINRVLGVLLCVEGLRETGLALLQWHMLFRMSGKIWGGFVEESFVVVLGLPLAMALITIGVGVCVWRLEGISPGSRRCLRVEWVSMMVAALIVYRAYVFLS